ncbi:MAG TPA: ABC transporter permease [Ignavibacteriaceae bacterium]|nr:ABC transporter permease [Ignavibacteriaceae bacterium]
MLKNYIKIAFRNLSKNKLYSFINITGLSIGIAGSLLIMVYIANQLSYESMHKNADNIVRVSAGFGNGTNTMKLAGAMPGIGPAAVEEIPEVKASVRFRKASNASIKVGDRKFTESNFFFADSNIFKVFTFPFIEGEVNNVLVDPNSIVISSEIAHKYFGDQDAIGKTIIFADKYNFKVTGVIQNVPANTYLKCDFIAPYSKAIQIFNINSPWMSWGEDYTYLYLKDNISQDELIKKLNTVLVKHTNDNFAKMLNFYTLPLRDIYLKSDMMGELGPTGNIKSIYIFSSIALLLLIIACLNFINLSTARSLRRSKEVGLRKVLGASRPGLFKQFWGESVIITLISVLISLIFFEFLNPVLFKYFDINISGINYFDTNFFMILAGIIIFVSLVAGIYPALFLSKYKPVDSLKGIKTPGSSGVNLRKALVVLQFSISIFLLIGTAAIYKQLQFMLNSDPGFDKKDILVVSYPASTEGAADKYTVLKNEFMSIPGVKNVSGVYSLPGANNKESQTFRLKGQPKDEGQTMRASGVDYDFIQTLGIDLAAGRNFSKEYRTDAENSIIINKTAVEKLGLKNPVGTEVYIPGGNGIQRLVKIIGVVKDFHLSSFHILIEPLFLYINPDRYYNIAVKIDPKYSKQIIPSLQESFKKVIPDKSFSYETLNEQYSSMYQSDEKDGTLFLIFTILSVIVASMGLFGLASFAIEVRMKEIGIRKVLGADMFSISFLLSKDFSKWVLISNLIAFPVAYYAISKWLDDFAYKTEMGIWIYILAAFIALFISVLTISFQSIKAANTNPVKTLRYE